LVLAYYFGQCKRKVSCKNNDLADFLKKVFVSFSRKIFFKVFCNLLKTLDSFFSDPVDILFFWPYSIIITCVRGHAGEMAGGEKNVKGL
jgi:hypothetical protein